MATEIENELTRYFAWIEEQTGLNLHRDDQVESVVALGEDAPRSDENASQGRQRRRRWMLVAAASIVVLALGLLAVAAVQQPDSVRTDTVPDTSRPLTTPAPSTNPASPIRPATTIPSSTSPSTAPPTTVAALSDEEIANATLLGRGEYAPGFVPLTLTGTAPWGAGMKMDPAIAEHVPACAPYIEAAFEVPTRDAAVAYTFFITTTTTPTPSMLSPQYVVVFPNEAAAEAMFDAITDRAFLDDCVSRYIARRTDPAFGDSDFVWFPFFPDGPIPTKCEDAGTTSTVRPGDPDDPPPFDFCMRALDPPELDLSADQVLVRAYAFFYHGMSQNGPRFVTATVRVGRVVAHIDGIIQYQYADAGVTTEQLQQLVSTIIDRARAALIGQPRPVTAP